MRVDAMDSGSELDWAAVVAFVADIALPVLAILVPTIIAIRLFRAERRDVRAADARARRMDAAAGVIMALAPMASIQPNERMQEKLWDLRARIAVYRTWIEDGDLSGDWLALRHREGMHRWAQVMEELSAYGGIYKMIDDELLAILEPSHRWAAETLEMLSAWMHGDIPVTRLRTDGARIIETYGAPPQPNY